MLRAALSLSPFLSLSSCSARLCDRPPDSPLYCYSSKVGAPPLSLPISPGKQGLPHEGKLFRLVLRDFLPVDLERNKRPRSARFASAILKMALATG